MDIQYFGGNCVRLSNKKATIVIDDNLAAIGGKSVAKAGDICLYTSTPESAAANSKITIDGPGEFEVSNISIQGVAAKAHVDQSGTNATIYKIVTDDLRIAIIGHVYPNLSNTQLEVLGTIDVLCIPVGGNGYTLDPVGALKLIKDIEPKLIIPTHYDDKDLSYPVPQQSLEDALKGLMMEPAETVAKIKAKHGELGDIARLVVLERQ